jgi:heptosyltransferase I
MSALLAVRPSSLGDVVWALAIAHDAAAARPGLAVDWVSEEAFVALPRMCGEVRRVVPVALRRWRRAPLARATWREARAFRAVLREERYDAILDLQEQVKGSVIARAALGVRHGFDRASTREPAAAWFDDVHHAVPRELHFVERCRRIAAAASGYAVEGPPRWRWNVPPPPACLPERPYVVAVHATTRANKHWPAERWRALLGGLDAAGFSVLLPHGSDAEEAESRAIAAGVDGAIVPPRLPLADVAAMLASAHVVVGVDTGLTHWAAALGAATLALFTTTDATLAGTAIAGPHARDLGGNGRVPSLDEARAALGERLRAAPRC